MGVGGDMKSIQLRAVSSLIVVADISATTIAFVVWETSLTCRNVCGEVSTYRNRANAIAIAYHHLLRKRRAIVRPCLAFHCQARLRKMLPNNVVPTGEWIDRTRFRMFWAIKHALAPRGRSRSGTSQAMRTNDTTPSKDKLRMLTGRGTCAGHAVGWQTAKMAYGLISLGSINEYNCSI